jgi:flagellar hook-basal body complex protein FliE
MADLKTIDALSAYNRIANLQNKIYSGTAVDNSSSPNFTQLVEEALGDTVNKLKKAEEKAKKSITGEVNLEDLATAVANAEMSLKTVVTIRDKLVTAFQDIIRMPI